MLSCVMPTTARRRWCIPWAIEYFLRQNADAMLIVVCDGEPVDDLIPDHPQIRYEHIDTMPLGAKFNRCVELAPSNWIVRWDDDDWHAPWRLSYTAANIDQHPGVEILGTRSMLFYNLLGQRLWRYDFPADERNLCGGSLAFHKQLWQRHPFDKNRTRGVDSCFLSSITPDEYDKHAVVLPDYRFYVATDHTDNIGRPHGYNDNRWSCDDTPLTMIMGSADAARYQSYSPPPLHAL